VQKWGQNHFCPEGLTLAAKIIKQFAERAIRLYEQEPGETEASSRFGLKQRRWVGRAVVPESAGTVICPRPFV
jgi:hypothetical protein